MKKLIFVIPFLFFVSCIKSAYEHNLIEMGKSVKRHIMYYDVDHNIETKIDFFKPISYEETPESERADSLDFYLFKVYMRGTWAYMDSYRKYNISDTLKYYFDKDMRFHRSGQK